MLGETPERVFTAYFFDDPFRALAISPSAGRSFTAEEVSGHAPVALITHRLAQSIQDDPAALVGSSLRVGGRPYTVIGIIPPRVRLYDTDLWIPMRWVSSRARSRRGAPARSIRCKRCASTECSSPHRTALDV